MIFNPFATLASSASTPRDGRLADLDARMQAFVSAKRRAGCNQVIESVETARLRIRDEMRKQETVSAQSGASGRA